jgi:hypothetical protein
MPNSSKKIVFFACLTLAAIALLADLLLLRLYWDVPQMRTRGTHYPLAADFAVMWSASKLAQAGQVAAAYDLDKIFQFQQTALGASHRFGAGFYYPPVFLLILLPLGLLPYFPALLIWLGVTFLGYAAALGRFCRHPATFLLGLTFLGVWENFYYGQNGLLTAALLGGGILLLHRHPYGGGVLLGLLSYKPNLVVLPLFALLISRQWRALGAGLGTITALVGLSLLIFGKAAWTAFWQAVAIPAEYMSVGFSKWSIMPSVLSAILSLGYNPTIAFVIQGAVSLAVLLGVVWVWTRPSSLSSRAAILILGTLLFTPYLHIYDLAIIALPLAWLWEDGFERDRFPLERPLLLLAFFLPLVVPIIYGANLIPSVRLQIGPVVLLTLFLLCLVREKKYG